MCVDCTLSAYGATEEDTANYYVMSLYFDTITCIVIKGVECNALLSTRIHGH